MKNHVILNTDNEKEGTYMKKAIFLFVALAMCLSLYACGNSVAADTESAEAFTEISAENSTPPVNADWEIITRTGHPRYYGSTSEAHKIWQGVAKEKIVYADSYHDYSDETVLLMTGYSREEKNEIIRGIEIYLENFEEPMAISLEEAIQLANGYVPYDIIAEWYEFEHSYCIKSKDSQDDTCYVVEYGLTDEASDAYYANEHSYSGRITVIFYTDSTTGNVNTITVGFGTPKWMGFLEKNGYEKTEWEFDFTA